MTPALVALSRTARQPRTAQQARVMVCDDSIVIRNAIARLLETDADIRVVARVAHGQAALDELRHQAVDVIVLDIEMPVMDGMTALPLLLRADPTLRIIMASTLTTRGAHVALQALHLGAADYLPKPSSAAIQDDSFKRELLAKVRGLARLRQSATVTPPHALTLRPAARQRAQLLAIGSSTGGPQALFKFIQGLGSGIAVPVVLTQHMPKTFTPILAEHLNKLGTLRCSEAVDGEKLRAGQLYLAPGDQHLVVEQIAGGLCAKLTTDPPENFCRPSVDPMLRSASTACGGRVLVVMLTGMGHDGLTGTTGIVEAGGTAIAQDEATSVVWGMPGAIAQAGLCHAVLPLDRLAAKVRDLLELRAS